MEYGADINAKVRKTTPLYYCITSLFTCHVIIHQYPLYFLQSTDTLSTALHEAGAINSVDTVKYLLSVGANKGNINHAGELPFDSTNDPEIRK